jgi:hypothetical protein
MGACKAVGAAGMNELSCGYWSICTDLGFAVSSPDPFNWDYRVSTYRKDSPGHYFNALTKFHDFYWG